MPLPKLPTKPAALLSPQDYPKADKDKIVKALTLIEPAARQQVVRDGHQDFGAYTDVEIEKHVERRVDNAAR